MMSKKATAGKTGINQGGFLYMNRAIGLPGTRWTLVIDAIAT